MSRYCPRCGRELDGRKGRPECPACGYVHFDSARPCVGILVTNEQGQVLLARRGVDPFRGSWDIVGGFMESNETPESAAVREVLEETGLHVEIRRLLGMWMDRYGDGFPTLNLHFVGTAIGGGPPIPMDDVMELRWFDASNLPQEIGFDNVRLALQAWLEGKGWEITSVRPS